jgi:hypothetical protein
MLWQVSEPRCGKWTLTYPLALSFTRDAYRLAFAVSLFKEALGIEKALGFH